MSMSSIMLAIIMVIIILVKLFKYIYEKVAEYNIVLCHLLSALTFPNGCVETNWFQADVYT